MLKMEGVSKSFPGVKALDAVSFSVKKGAVHALVGENGAGKSTLIKIISGAYTADSGKVWLDGEQIIRPNSAKMLEKGVAVIYQELMLLPHRTVAENVFLGRYPKNKFGAIDDKRMIAETKRIAQELNLNLEPETLVKDLSVAKRQMVEIAKAMSRDAKLIVLDEPTAVLGENELEGLFRLIHELKEKGVTFIYISHRLKEVFELCTDLTILKDGVVVESGKVSDYDTDKLISCMVGRDLKDIYPSRSGREIKDTVVLKVSNLYAKGVEDVSFQLHEGEILGIAGLAGAGRTEVLRSIIGADPIISGSIEINNQAVHFKTPKEAIKHKINMVPEERKLQGLMLKQTTTYNTGIASIRKFLKYGLINLKKEKENALMYMELFNTRPKSTSTVVQNLSGGNQQKIVISKCLSPGCKILLVDECTRGVDVGAKQEIYKIVDNLVRQGMSILMVSSELPELLGMCDRIMVMNEGRLAGILNSEEANEEALMRLATREVV